MSIIAAQIDDVLRQGLTGLLKKEGYAKSGRVWHKAVGEGDAVYWRIVHVQASSGNIGALGHFTVNLGVYAGPVAAMAGQRPLSGKPKEEEATVRERLTKLASDDGSDHWWEIAPDSDLAAIAADVVQQMQAHGLPWLAAHTDIAQLAKAMAPTPSVASFSAALLAGDRAEAERRLQLAVASRPAAKAHYAKWAQQHGIPL